MAETGSAGRLLEQAPVVANVGVGLFAEALRAQGGRVVEVDWRPPAGGGLDLVRQLERLATPEVEAANREAIQRLMAAQPVVVDVRPAGEVVPGLAADLILHAGPPITWERLCGPMRGAVIGALLYEGRASTPEEAIALAESGRVHFDPCHHHAAVGPMAGIITASMPVFVVENRTHGNRSFATINEGLGKVLRYGAYAPEVIERLRWIQEKAGPLLGEAIRASGGIDLRALLAQAVQMGDEGHNRNRAATSLLTRQLAPFLARVDAPPQDTGELFVFLAGNDHFALNLSMAACKAGIDVAHGIPGCTIVSTMARNGTDFGIRVSGLGDRWFTAPAGLPVGLYFPGFGPADANPDLGDSTITETAGIGGFAMGGAPAIVQFVGGTPEDALGYTREMYEVTAAEHEHFKLPTLGFRGTPAGIDLRLVMQTGILPVINTGIAHREPGIGQIGAGIVRPPMACFEAALRAADEGRRTKDEGRQLAER